jgi:hypothetical protein
LFHAIDHTLPGIILPQIVMSWIGQLTLVNFDKVGVGRVISNKIIGRVDFQYSITIPYSHIFAKVIAKRIESDPMTYNDAILGMPADEYCARISGTNTWGGAIGKHKD